MKRALKYIFLTVLTGACFAITADLCQKQTKGFWLQNVLAKGSYEEPIEYLSLKEMVELKTILNQPFTFLKKGQQCFTFLSQDGNYVLKLFRWEKLSPPFYTNLLPDSMTEKTRLEKEKKRIQDFTSYKIAWHRLKEETGLIFLQLGKREKLDIPLTLYDKIGIKHTLSSSQVGFILQKKADDFYPIFKEKKEQELIPFFKTLLSLLESRAKEGISDSDITLEYNMGILEGKPMLFDIGNLAKKDTDVNKESALILSTLEDEAPSLADLLRGELLPQDGK